MRRCATPIHGVPNWSCSSIPIIIRKVQLQGQKHAGKDCASPGVSGGFCWHREPPWGTRTRGGIRRPARHPVGQCPPGSGVAAAASERPPRAFVGRQQASGTRLLLAALAWNCWPCAAGTQLLQGQSTLREVRKPCLFWAESVLDGANMACACFLLLYCPATGGLAFISYRTSSSVAFVDTQSKHLRSMSLWHHQAPDGPLTN